MAFNKEGKPFGLEIRQKKPAKPAPPLKKAAPIFGKDDDDEEDEGFGGPQGRGVEREIARQAASKKFNKETEQLHAAALAEDPNAFSYDEVYEDIHARKHAPRVQEQVERKSKYIESLLDKAKRREQEREIVFERKLAKDRVKEDTEFGDKEKFVTRAYREKLEERKKWLAEEQRREAVEAANDVTKRADLSDLYRNLFHARTKKDDAAQPKEAGGDLRPEAGKRGGADKPERIGKPSRSGEERGRGEEEGGHREGDTDERLARVGDKDGRFVDGAPGAAAEGIASGTALAGEERGLLQSSQDEDLDQEGARSEGPSQGVAQLSKATETPSDADAPTQPQKERVSAGSLSAAKERYLSRKKQRTQDPS